MPAVKMLAPCTSRVITGPRLYSSQLQSFTRFAPVAHPQVCRGQQEESKQDALRPDTVNAPLLHDVLLQERQHQSAEESDLRHLKGQEVAAKQREQGNQGIPSDAGNRDRQMSFAVDVLIETAWRKDGKPRMVDNSAVPMFCDSARRRGRCTRKASTETTNPPIASRAIKTRRRRIPV